MSSSKQKQKNCQTLTLDEAHKRQMAIFSSRKQQLAIKLARLNQLKMDLVKINNIEPSLLTTNDIRLKSKLLTDISLIEDDINDVENDVSELDYYAKTSEILVNYYDINNKITAPIQITSISQLDSKINMTSSIKKRKKNNTATKSVSIFEYILDKSNKQEPEKQTLVTLLNNESNENNKPITQPVLPQTPAINKASLNDTYMTLINNDEHTNDRKSVMHKIKYCPTCKTEKTLIHSDGMLVCKNCGEGELVIVDNEKPGYKDSLNDIKPGYPYKRINHFNEWLAQIQAKESTEISDEIYNKILAELHKNRFTDFKKLCPSVIKKILRHLGLTQYYEHTTHIISKLSGIPPPTFTRDTEEQLRIMFRMIQTPFDKYRPINRQNFLSYSYVLRKFCELLELDDFIECFPLLKNRIKLIAQDNIWQKICNDLRWQYIPSV